MAGMPEFSVIIPTFGRQSFLAESVGSALQQTLSDWECIVVDDASPEQPILPDDPRIRLLRHTTTSGPAAARNTGIAAARGRYLAFLDDDDIWLPHRLAHAAAAHARAPVVICWQSTVGSDDVPGGRVLEGDVRDIVLDAITPHLGATSIDRAVVPMFDERYEAGEDVEWWLRVAQKSTVATTQTADFLYRVHSGYRGRTGQQNRVRGADMLLEQYADWFDNHPRAKAFRLKRMGLSALSVNDKRLALRCFSTSMRLQPDVRTAWHAVRVIARSVGSRSSARADPP